MTLAARCPACGTVFRVVQDQLRVSEGWVRCGRCTEVFNAIETLVEIEAEVPPRAASRGDGAPAAAKPERTRVLDELARVARAETPDDDGPGDGARGGAPAWPPPAPSEVAPEAAPRREPAAAAEAPSDAEPAPAAAPEGGPDFIVEPDFVRRAERAARWRRPGVRVTLALLALAGAALLAAQAVFEYRDLAAARWPALRPVLEAACARLGCRVEAPRAIDALAVESSGLLRIEGTSMYRLSVVLRNRAPIAIAAPAIDLTLTDTQGGVIARRVVRLSEFGSAQTSVPAQAELPLQVALSATERPVSGYTIEIFYP